MLNRPFSATNINIFDEKTQTAIPASFFGQNVLLAQDQHRKVFDTLTTSIRGVPEWAPRRDPQHSVTFTFNRHPQICARPDTFWQWQTPQMQTLAHMHQRNAVDLMHLQNQLNAPCQLRFHLDNQTSTSDLGAKHNLTELKNLAAILQSKWPPWLEAPTYRDPKRLILRNVTAKVEGNVYDVLEEADDKEERNKKKVNFNFGNKDEEIQVKMCCQNCDDKEVRPKAHKKKTRKRRKRSDNSTDDDDGDDDDDDKR